MRTPSLSGTRLASLAIVITLAACEERPSPVAPTEQTQPPESRRDLRPSAAPGEYIVVFRDEVSNPRALGQQLAAAHGLQIEHVYSHTIKGFSASIPEAALNGLRRHPLVEYIEPNAIAYLDAAPAPVGAPSAGLRLRLVADDLAASLADGAEVPAWPNLGSEADAAPADGSRRPTYHAGVGGPFAGHAHVGFNEGGDDDEALEVAGVSDHGSATLVAVFSQDDATNHNYGIVGLWASSSDRAGFVTRHDGGANVMSYWDPTNGWKDADEAASANIPYVVVWRLEAGVAADYQVNGTAAGSVPMSAPIHTPFDRYVIGASEPVTSSRFDGQIAELLLYDRPLSDCERDNLVADLGSRYGIAVSVTGGTVCEAPADPTGLTATAVAYDRIDLAWADVATNEEGYRVERREGSSAAWVEIASLPAGATSYVDDRRIQATEYCYRVVAYNGDGESGYSNIDCATTPSAPPGACVDTGNHDDLAELWNITRIGADQNPVWQSTQVAGCEIVPWYMGLDSGVDSDHPDLNVAGIHNFVVAEPGRSGEDANGHGTHTAGSAAAIDGNGGVVGVAPGAPIYGFRVCSDDGSCEYADIIAAVDSVTAMKAANPSQPMVVNMSLAGPTSDAMDTAVRRSLNAGVHYAIAAGNGVFGACFFPDDAQNKSPARTGDDTINALDGSDGDDSRINGLITTTSSNANDTSTGCNYGHPVTVASPGFGIKSTWLNGGYNTISGTSMAAPHTAGAIILYLQSYPDATPVEVEQAILQRLAPWSGTPTPNADGRLDVEDL